MVDWTKCKGLLAATFTPFNKDLTINHQIIPTYIDHLVLNGVKQVFVNGTSGECMSLTVEERKTVAETWITKGREKLTRIIIQCGAGNLEETKDLAIHAANLKADCIAITTPTYFKPRCIDDLVEYCFEISKCVPQIPVLYYHFPDLTGVTFKMCDFFENITQKNKIPNLVGCKFTSVDLADAIQASLVSNGKYDVILGSDTIFLGGLAMGLKSSIGISYNMCGPMMNKMIEYFEKGDLHGARKMQNDMQVLFRLSHQQGNTNELVAVFKCAMKLIDSKLDFGPVRLPLRVPSVEKMENMMNLLKNLHIMK